MADTVTSDSQGREREHEDVSPEVGVNEFWAHLMGLAGLKGNRTYEEFLALGLESARASQESGNRSRTHFDKVVTDAQQYDNQRQNLANLALANAVDTANSVNKNAADTMNLVNKQSVAHRDIAIDRTWNVDEANAVFKTIIDRLSNATNQQDRTDAIASVLAALGLADAVKDTSTNSSS